MSNDYTDVYTAPILKKHLATHLYYFLQCPIIVDEHQFMDVFAIKRSGYTAEFEIKVSRGDLRRETKLFKAEMPKRGHKDYIKWEKHAKYLGSHVEEQSELLRRYDSLGIRAPYYVPNEFWFYIPHFLAETALQDTVGTPYGIVTCNLDRDQYETYTVIKKAAKLNTIPATSQIYRECAHSLTIRNRIFHIPIAPPTEPTTTL